MNVAGLLMPDPLISNRYLDLVPDMADPHSKPN
jgi:hypothetical protein